MSPAGEFITLYLKSTVRTSASLATCSVTCSVTSQVSGRQDTLIVPQSQRIVAAHPYPLRRPGLIFSASQVRILKWLFTVDTYRESTHAGVNPPRKPGPQG